ncbi:hypothetical protein ABZZ36_32135 [Actinacidiphila glaucinigra]|uniref:hypothetical protein n=1 Tax=Actinacidiphila glaucinigra TaxID=235986 RepID=UPI0033BDDB1F
MVQAFELPEDYSRQRQVLCALLEGTVDGAVYHRRALIHVHGQGSLSPGRQLNVAAWALASTWRGTELPYGLYGTAVVTGPNCSDGGYGAVDENVSQHVQAVSAAVSQVLASWVDRPPMGEAQARAEVLRACPSLSGAAFGCR